MIAAMSKVKYAIDKASEASGDGTMVRAEAGPSEDLATESEAEAIAAFDQRPGRGWTLVRITSGQSEIIRRK